VVRELSDARSSPILAAGAVLWRRHDGRLEVGLVHRRRYGDWTLPKGKVDPGEHLVAAAVREVAEETGHHVTLGRPLPATRYHVRGRPKQVCYWSARADDTAPPWVPTPEVDEVLFLPVDDALRQLSYRHDVEVVAALADGPLETTPLVLLRHTDSVDRSDWSGSDRERPLSGQGAADASRLRPLLAAYGLTRVVSSDAVRCTDTVLPYAREHGLVVEIEPLLSEDGHTGAPERTAALIQKLLADDAPTVICSHRPVLPELLAAATERAQRVVPSQQLAPGAMHVLHHRAGAVIDIETHDVNHVDPHGPEPAAGR
jgi:8-oxo-(d)GTP phosphatase